MNRTPMVTEAEHRGKLAAKDEEIARLRAALTELRRPVLCSIFGVPSEEVTRLLGIIDAALAE
jgi:hypothetical protein